MLLEVRLDQVRKHRTMTGSGAALALDEAIAQLLALADPASIAPMLLLLSDESVWETSNWSLLQAAEAFDDSVYVGEMLLALPTLNRTAPRWAETLILRILDREATRLDLARRLVGAPRPEKDAVNAVCDRILQMNPGIVAKGAAVMFASRT